MDVKQKIPTFFSSKAYAVSYIWLKITKYGELKT